MPIRLPSFGEDHTTSLLPGTPPGLGVKLFFWEVVMAVLNDPPSPTTDHLDQQWVSRVWWG